MCVSVRAEKSFFTGFLSDMKCKGGLESYREGKKECCGFTEEPFSGNRNEERQNDSKWKDIDRKGADREKEGLFNQLLI